MSAEDVGLRYFTDADPDGDFDDLHSGWAQAQRAAFGSEVALCRRVAARRSLEETFTTDRGQPADLRWLKLYLIAEYARHAGRADLLRERSDGVTGD